MAIVINPTNINTALESVFKNVSRTYTLYLRGLSGVVLDSEVVTFDTASGGSIDLTSAVIFGVASGSKVVSIQLKDELDVVYFTEELSPQPDYDDNGTYTINNITITYGV